MCCRTTPTLLAAPASALWRPRDATARRQFETHVPASIERNGGCMSARRARLGVVGLGVAGRRHSETVARCLANTELVALVDANDAIATEFSERLGAPRTDYAALLADE